MTNETYIAQHRNDDIRRLALTRAPEGVDLKWCLQQIEGWQIARRKLPKWAACEGLHYPARLSMEQCSSEETALYKRRIVERLIVSGTRQTMADLTGGLGVDFSYLASLFDEATYVEKLPELCQLAEHNLPLLGIQKTQLHIKNVNSTDDLSLLTSHFSFIYLDPARRDHAGRKTVGIEDCTPNLLELQDTLLAQADWVMVKLSPMLDITQALRQLHGVCEVHVVGVQGECKELLFVMKSTKEEKGITIHCVNLGTEEDEVSVPMSIEESERVVKETPISYALNLSTPFYIYEPNASVLKAGVQDALCERYGVEKLHPKSNLFVGPTAITHFPGRRFRIVTVSDFSKQGLKSTVGDLHKANLTIRNFPSTVNDLRRRLRLAEGGDIYLFATTRYDGSHILIRCERE